MKAVLVIEIDDELGKEMHSCDFVVTDRYGSNIIYPTISFKPIPEKVETPKIIQEQIDGWHKLAGEYIGWNACIDEILGEVDNE